MLGKAVYEQFAPHCQVLATDIDLNEPWLEYGDVIDFQKISEKAFKFEPDLIINLAALTDLEYCEKNPEITWKTNALGAENMALLSKAVDATHIYISTAGIFDGQKEYYNDFEQPNPLSVYAKSKYYGEVIVETEGQEKKIPADYVIIASTRKSYNPLGDKIREIVKEVYEIGDCVKPASITEAYDDANYYARLI